MQRKQRGIMQGEEGWSHLQTLCVHPGARLSRGDPPAPPGARPPLPMASRSVATLGPLLDTSRAQGTHTPCVTSTPSLGEGRGAGAEIPLEREKVKKKFNTTPES